MKRQAGFSLVELAIVILIMGLILGGLAMPLSTQLEHKRIRETRSQIADIEAAIQGFAIANGHLPCPAAPNSDGLSAISAGGCYSQHGFVPASTLGLAGRRNSDNLLLDAWSNPLRYSVSASDVDGDGNWDFVVPGEMRDVSIPLLSPDLVVCSTSAGATAVACSGPSTTLTDSAPIVVFSMGKDWASFSSADQLENVGTTSGGGPPGGGPPGGGPPGGGPPGGGPPGGGPPGGGPPGGGPPGGGPPGGGPPGGGPPGGSYPIASDVVFVSRRASEQAGNEFDDIVYWSAPTRLYQRLVDGGQLP